MSVESANGFMERMKTDNDFATRVGEALTKEDRWDILRASGFLFTDKEFNAVCDDYSRMQVEAVAKGSRLMPCCSSGDARCKDIYA